VLIGIALYYVKRKKGAQLKSIPGLIRTVVSAAQRAAVTQNGNAGKRSAILIIISSLKMPILLFGDLPGVLMAEGVDITKYFTPLIKELFLVILLTRLGGGRRLKFQKS